MPTTPSLPHKNDPDLSLIEFVLRGWGVLSNTSPADLTGHPAISLPMSNVNGLPVGLMATGRHFDDGALLRLASSVERKYGWASGTLDLPSGH
jgi:amidase